MPRVKAPQFDIVSDLRECSIEADNLITEDVHIITSYSAGITAWFSQVKDTITAIKNCESVADITYPPKLSSFLGEEAKTKNVAVSEAQREHVHASIPPESTVKNTEILPSSTVNDSKVQGSDYKDKSSAQMVAPPLSSCAKVDPKIIKTLHTPETKMKDSCNTKIGYNLCKTNDPMATPILNCTFNKALDKTFATDSGASTSSHQKNKILNVVVSDSNVKTGSSSITNFIANSIGCGAITRSGSKKKLSTDKRQQTEESDTTTPSASEVSQPIANSKTRSGCKRKSSTKRNKYNKKTKTGSSDNNTTSASKAVAQYRLPLVDKNVTRAAGAWGSENKAKLSAVIVPTLQKKSVISKEKQILEEIKKKEEKANENIKRVLAERHMKAEQNKKNREEKKAKTLQKRMQMEKEKEGRLEKREIEAKTTQIKAVKENGVKNTAAKTRTQELIEQHMKTSKSGVLSTSKQNEACGDTLVKTPISKKVSDCENYELTPLPDSSTYNFSDDSEDEKPQGKPIPLWAQGVHLKSALLQQFYHPVDTEELFGSHIDSPDLAEIFYVKKKQYLKRTSSAVWNSPPNFEH